MAVIFYSARTGRVRRIIANSAGESRTDAALELVHKANKGEAGLQVTDPVDLLTIQSVVSGRTGLVPRNDRYVAVSNRNGVVSHVLIADPDCDDVVKGHTLVIHSRAIKDWRQMHDGSFQRSMLEIDQDMKYITQMLNTTLVDAALLAYQTRLADFETEKIARAEKR